MSIKASMAKLALKASKHSPEILLGVGVVGVVAGTVLACKETLRLEEIVSKHQDTVGVVKKSYETQTFEQEDGSKTEIEYSDKDYRSDLARTYIKTGWELSKNYAPAVIVGGLGLAAIFASHNIQKGRLAAVGAAYATVAESYKIYRQRVRDELGEDADRHFKFGAEKSKTDIFEEDEKGKMKKTASVECENVTRDDNLPSEYAKFFDETCSGWDKDPYYTQSFLRQQQRYCNDKLKAQGYLFLNDVYEVLGIKKTPAGQMVGWIYDEKNPIGDNHVDFGLYDVESEAMRRFVNGLEEVVLLDFNVDGVIYDKI